MSRNLRITGSYYNKNRKVFVVYYKYFNNQKEYDNFRMEFKAKKVNGKTVWFIA